MPLRAYHDIDHAKSTLLVGVLDILDFLVVWASLFFLFPFSATWGLSRLCELSDTCDCPLSIVRNRLVTESEALNLCAIIYHALCTAVRGSLQQLTRVCVYMPVA